MGILQEVMQHKLVFIETQVRRLRGIAPLARSPLTHAQHLLDPPYLDVSSAGVSACSSTSCSPQLHPPTGEAAQHLNLPPFQIFL